METSTKEQKEKENALINLEWVNSKSASMLNFEELRRRVGEAKKKKLVEAN